MILEKIQHFELNVKKARELLYLGILSEKDEIIFDDQIEEIYQDVFEFIIHKNRELEILINQILNN